MREQKRLDLDQAVNDLLLDQRKPLPGKRKLTTQYHGNVVLLCHSVMANEHGQRLRFSVLLTKHYADFVIEEAEFLDQKPAYFIRDLVEKHFKKELEDD